MSQETVTVHGASHELGLTENVPSTADTKDVDMRTAKKAINTEEVILALKENIYLLLHNLPITTILY